jgi:hypothetical protein
MYKFSHLFDDVLSIYFVSFAHIIIFGLHLHHYTQLLVAKINKCKIFLSTRCNARAYLPYNIKSTLLFPLSLLFCKKVSRFFIINSRELLTGGSSN